MKITFYTTTQVEEGQSFAVSGKLFAEVDEIIESCRLESGAWKTIATCSLVYKGVEARG